MSQVIEELTIRDLGVIREARLELRAGLTVITGETGAGKTMLLTGLGLMLGGKADAGRVRPGAARSEVEAVVGVPASAELLDRLAELEVPLDEGALIISRTVPVEGRGRSRLGGRSVPSAVLAELAPHLVSVHGQGQQYRLARSDVQREVLDRVGAASIGPLALEYRALLELLLVAERELDSVVNHGDQRRAEAESIGTLLGELDSLSPVSGEVEALAAEAQRLSHAESLRLAAEAAHDSLSSDAGDGADALSLITAARRALEQERIHDPHLGAVADRLGASVAELADVASELAAYSASVDTDPARIERVQQRRADLAALARRHDRSIDQLVEQAPELRARHAELADGDERLAALSAEVERLRAEIAPVALALHDARSITAHDLSRRVGVELAALAMPQARLEWEVGLAAPEQARPSVELPGGTTASLGPHGIDEVVVMLASHREASLQPLSKAASGGELSRVMLAVEVVLAGANPVPTMVFDEIDAGVGGRAAVEIGRRLAALARTTQVLVVTHLPQVAAFADQHLVVVKSDDLGVTSSDVALVEGDQRVRELARMLAGLEESESAADHARELLDLAHSERSTS